MLQRRIGFFRSPKYAITLVSALTLTCALASVLNGQTKPGQPAGGPKVDLSGPWTSLAPQETVRILQNGSAVEASIVQLSADLINTYGFKESDWSFSGSFDGRTFHGKIHLHYALDTKLACPDKWDSESPLDLTLSEDGTTLSGAWYRRHLNTSDCTEGQAESVAISFVRTKPVEPPQPTVNTSVLDVEWTAPSGSPPSAFPSAYVRFSVSIRNAQPNSEVEVRDRLGPNVAVLDANSGIKCPYIYKQTYSPAGSFFAASKGGFGDICSIVTDADGNGSGVLLGQVVKADRLPSERTFVFGAQNGNEACIGGDPWTNCDEAQLNILPPGPPLILKNPPLKTFAGITADELADLSSTYNMEAAIFATGAAGFWWAPPKAGFLAMLSGGDWVGSAAADKISRHLKSDPVDQNFTVIAAPSALSFQPVSVSSGLTQTEADAFNTLLQNEAQVAEFLQAGLTAHEREAAAVAAGDTLSASRQLQAAWGYAAPLAELLDSEARVRANVVIAWHMSRRPSVIVSADDIRKLQRDGLPPAIVQALVQMGTDKAKLDEIRILLTTLDANKFGASRSFPEVLLGPNLETLKKDSMIVKQFANQVKATAATRSTLTVDGNGPCATKPGEACRVTGDLDGSMGTVVHSMQWQILVPSDRIAAGALATTFIPTGAGIEFLTCPVAIAGSPTKCVGTTVANALRDGTVHVFANDVEVGRGQIVKTGGLLSFLSLPRLIFLGVVVLVIAILALLGSARRRTTSG